MEYFKALWKEFDAENRPMHRELLNRPAPPWDAWSWVVTTWPMLLAMFFSAYSVHRLWIRPPRYLKRGTVYRSGVEVWQPSLRAQRWFFGCAFVLISVFVWSVWWHVMSVQDELVQQFWNDPAKAVREYHVRYPPLVENLPWKFWSERLLVGLRFLSWQDLQMRFWRGYMDIMVLVVVLFVGVSHLLNRMFANPHYRAPESEAEGKHRVRVELGLVPPANQTAPSAHSGDGPAFSDVHLTRRGMAVKKGYYLLFALGFLLFAHGSLGTIYTLAYVVSNYALARLLGGTRLFMPVYWTFNCAVLVLADLNGGWQLIVDLLPYPYSLLLSFGRLKWHVYLKLNFARAISYGCDYHWWKMGRAVSSHVKKEGDYLYFLQEHPLHPSSPNDSRSKPISSSNPHSNSKSKEVSNSTKDSSWTTAQGDGYGLVNYLVYMFYTPLYIAGPVLSFQAFVHQLRRPQFRFPGWRALSQLLAVYVLTHLTTHLLGFVYYNACFDRLDLYETFEPLEMAMAATFMGWFVYMKFFLVWKWMRAWALWDGVEATENMRGCFLTSYTFRDFWRSWHVSMHVWIMRYVYVPLGGTRSQFWSAWVIFIFIGLWHDLKIQWAAWALFNGFFYCGEIVMLFLFRKPYFDGVRRKWYYDILVALVGALDGFFIVTANAAMINGFDRTWVALGQFLAHSTYAIFTIGLALYLAVAVGILFLNMNQNLNHCPESDFDPPPSTKLKSH